MYVDPKGIQKELKELIKKCSNTMSVTEELEFIAESEERLVKLFAIHSVIERAFDAGRERIPHPDWDFVYEDHEEYIKKHGL